MGERSSVADIITQLGENLELLERYAETDFPTELLDFRPAVEDAWTIREHLSHLLDVEIVNCIWLRTAIAEPGVDVWAPPGMLSSWLSALNYSGQEPADMVAAIKVIRKLNL